MLVISRGVGESFLIGANIRVTVVAVEGGRAKLVLEAPDNTVVAYEEMVENIEYNDRKS